MIWRQFILSIADSSSDSWLWKYRKHCLLDHESFLLLKFQYAACIEKIWENNTTIFSDQNNFSSFLTSNLASFQLRNLASLLTAIVSSLSAPRTVEGCLRINQVQRPVGIVRFINNSSNIGGRTSYLFLACANNGLKHQQMVTAVISFKCQWVCNWQRTIKRMNTVT